MMFKNPIFLALFLCVSLLLFFAGLLGENHHVDDLVDNYFLELKSGNFNKSCIPMSINGKDITVINEEECSHNNFIFNVSLLEYFELQGNDRYTVNLNRNQFWVPYINSDTIKVGLNLSRKPANGFNLFDNTKYMSDVFIVKRHNLRWKIQKMNVSNPKLIKIFNRLKQGVDFDKYVETTDIGFQLKNITINSTNLSNVDKRLIKYNIQKINRLLEQ